MDHRTYHNPPCLGDPSSPVFQVCALSDFSVSDISCLRQSELRKTATFSSVFQTFHVNFCLVLKNDFHVAMFAMVDVLFIKEMLRWYTPL